LYEVIRGSVIDQIIRDSGKIDVYVVSEESVAPKRVLPRGWLPHRPWNRYLASLLLVLLMTLCGFPLRQFLDATNLVMLYLAAVVIAAVFLGRGPATLASFVSVFSFDYFFVNPRFSFSVSDTQYLLTFIGLLIVGLIISNSAAMLRDQVNTLRKRNRQTQAINDLSRDLTSAAGLEQVLQAVILNISQMFNRDTIILLPEGARLVNRASTPGFTLNVADLAVAEWSFKNGKPAGKGTDTLPSSALRYIPLQTAHGSVGILGVKPQDHQDILTHDQRAILDSYANLSAMAIERASFSLATSSPKTPRVTRLPSAFSLAPSSQARSSVSPPIRRRADRRASMRLERGLR